MRNTVANTVFVLSDKTLRGQIRLPSFVQQSVQSWHNVDQSICRSRKLAIFSNWFDSGSSGTRRHYSLDSLTRSSGLENRNWHTHVLWYRRNTGHFWCAVSFRFLAVVTAEYLFLQSPHIYTHLMWKKAVYHDRSVLTLLTHGRRSIEEFENFCLTGVRSELVTFNTRNTRLQDYGGNGFRGARWTKSRRFSAKIAIETFPFVLQISVVHQIRFSFLVWRTDRWTQAGFYFPSGVTIIYTPTCLRAFSNISNEQ